MPKPVQNTIRQTFGLLPHQKVYVTGNVQGAYAKINNLKMTLSEKEFLYRRKLLVAHTSKETSLTQVSIYVLGELLCYLPP